MQNTRREDFPSIQPIEAPLNEPFKSPPSTPTIPMEGSAANGNHDIQGAWRVIENGCERYMQDLVHWQSAADLPERRRMVQRIMNMTRLHRRRSGGGSQVENNFMADKTPSLAKRIELSLYGRAASFEEYKDLNTLRRRMQSLVALSYHETANRKKRVAEDYLGNDRSLKRRLECNGKKSAIKHAMTKYTSMSHQTNGYYIIDNEDVLRSIYSFIDGRETIQHRLVCKRASTILYSCVHTLLVSVRQLAVGFSLHSYTLLNKMTHLVDLEVMNLNKPCRDLETDTALHAWGCSELDITQDNTGENVVLQVAQSIEAGSCTHLRRLRLVSVFTNTCQTNALHKLCQSLQKGSCLQLADLLLGGNSFSDGGTVDIADLLRSGVLANLVRLDLRRNYIGESGMKRIMHALFTAQCKRLRYLCMGGNIINDNSVNPVIELLGSKICPQLRFLGLEDNFISSQGVENIIQAARTGGMMPKLHKVSHTTNTAVEQN